MAYAPEHGTTANPYEINILIHSHIAPYGL